MEEDIKILEEIIECYKECFVEDYEMCVDVGMRLRDLEAIQNIIARYKELEELLEEKTLRIGFESKDNYIPKSKVKEVKHNYELLKNFEDNSFEGDIKKRVVIL